MEKYTFRSGKIKKEKHNSPFSTDNGEESEVVENAYSDSITEDFAKSIDWVKLTKNFNLDRISDIVKTIGNTNRDKKIIIKSIHDAEFATGNMSKIPYSVDTLLDKLYKEYDENHKSLWEVHHNQKESLKLNKLLKGALDNYMEDDIGTDKDIDKIVDCLLGKANDKSEISYIIYKINLPEDFKTPEAELLMQKLVNAGLLTNNWQPVNLSIAERGYLADEISSRLQIKSKWKVMGALWKENPETLRQGKIRAVGQIKTGAFIEKLKKVLN